METAGRRRHRLTVGSLLVMPLLGLRKRRAGSALGNQLVLADAAETILCASLAAATLLGLVLFAASGWWQADPVAALAVAWFAVREGREAWHGGRGPACGSWGCRLMPPAPSVTQIERC